MLFDHVNLRCENTAAMAEFFESLGVAQRGDRPAFDSPGFWLYDDGGTAVIHLSEHSSKHQRDGVVDHIAFRIDDIGALRTRLAAASIAFTERQNHEAGVVQIKVDAPEGLVVELQSALS